MKIDVIIPNFNGSHLLEKNLPYVLKSLEDYKLSNVVIVDDGSEIIEKEKLKIIVQNLNSNKIKILQNETNMGFSSSVNKGIYSSDAEYVVLLNTDVSPSKNFLKKPIELLQLDSSLFGVGFVDKSIEGKKTVLRGRGVAKWEKGFIKHKKGDPDKNDTFWLSGGSSVLRKDFVLKIGAFDEIFNPFYWEDIDLSYRAVKSGYKIQFSPESLVTHIHSVGAIKTHFSQNEVNQVAFRNELIFIWKNITDISLLTEHIIYLKLHLLKSLISRDFSVIKGFVQAFLKLPDIISKRSRQKKYYVLKDTDVFK